MKAQHPTRQTYQKSEIDKTHTAIKSQTRNPLQTNQSDCDKRFQSMSSDLNLIQAQIETLKRQDTNIKSKKQQSNNQNYTNQHSHSKNTALDPRSGGQTQNVEILAATAGTKKTMKILRNIGEQFKNQVNINATHHKMQ